MTALASTGAHAPRERIAISAAFFLNGYLVGNWAPRIPAFKAGLGIDEATLGLMILAFGLGSLLTMPLVGAAIAHDGSRRVLLRRRKLRTGEATGNGPGAGDARGQVPDRLAPEQPSM